MKKILLCFTIALGLNLSSAQTKKSVDTNGLRYIERNNEKIYTEVEIMAKYRLGFVNFNQSVNEDVKKCFRNDKLKKDYEIPINILISNEGKIEDVVFVDESNLICKDIITSAIMKCNDWIPATINGKPVNSFLKFTLKYESRKVNRNMTSRNDL